MIKTDRVSEIAVEALDDIDNKVELGLLGCDANGDFIGTLPASKLVATQHGFEGEEWEVFAKLYCTMAYHTLNNIKKTEKTNK